jgi:ABC-type transporter Mla subunit MlaD
MPQRVSDSFRVIRELDLSHRYEAQVGLITIVVFAVVIALALVMTGWRIGGSGRVELLVRFSNVAGLNGGDVVQISGVTVGHVRGLELQPSGDVLVRVRLERGARPRRDAHAEIVSLNLMGDRAVAYSPGVAAEYLPSGAVLPGTIRGGLGDELGRAAGQSGVLAESAAAFAHADLQRELDAVRVATARALAALDRVHGDSVITAAAGVLRTSEATFARLDSVADAVAAEHGGEGLERAAASAGDLTDAVGAARDALGRVERRLKAGEGGVARLPGDSAFRNEIAATRRSFDLLLAKALGRRPPPSSTPPARR